MPLDINARLQLAKTDPDAFAWIFDAGRIVPEDSYLYQKLGGSYSKYEEMLLDPQVRGKLGERVGALLGRSVLVSAATSGEADQAAADTARHIIDQNLVPYESICANFLFSGLIIGFAVQAVQDVEERELVFPIYDDVGQLVRLERKTALLPMLEFVPQRRFTFHQHELDEDIPFCTDEDLDPQDAVLVHGYELRLLTKRSPIKGERCPKDRFFTYTFGSMKGLPYGYGLGAMIRKYYEIRNECLKSGVLTGDRVGSPATHGTYPDDLDPSVPEDAALISAFTRLVKAISPNAYAVTTDGFKINFPEPRSGGHQIIKWLYDTSALEISRAIWGEGSYSEKSTGSYSAEQQQAENRNENVVDTDCNLLDEQLGAQFWRWVGEKNYPDVNFPVVRRETYAERRKREEEKAKEERRSQRVQTDRTLVIDMGLNVTQDYISEVYGDAFTLPEQNPVPTFSHSVDFGANVHRFLAWQNLRIGVRYLPGETRFPQYRNSKKLQSGYGYLEGYRYKGKAVKCYIYPGLLQDAPVGSDVLYEIIQVDPKTEEIDEIKLAIAYPSIEDAEQAYRREMPDAYFGGIRQIHPAELKAHATHSEHYAEPVEDAIGDAYEERLVGSLSDAYAEALQPIQQFIEQIANSDGTDAEKYRIFVDGIYDLYNQMNPELLASVLGEGLTAGYLAGMYSERVDRDAD